MNKKYRFAANIFLLLSLTFSFVSSAISAEETWDPTVIQSPEKYIVKRFWKDGKVIVKIIVPGRPPKIFRAQAATPPQPNIALGTNTLLNVPAFNWSYGCSATSAAMMMGYYDNYTYVNMYAGLANDGVCPMDNSIWNPGIDPREGTSECPLSATHLGYDEKDIRGHVDDYWIDYGSTEPDPCISNWTEHTQGDCTGDYMGTNQSSFGNPDGSTTFYYYEDGSPTPGIPDEEIPGSRDGCHGLKLFAESRTYTVETNFYQLIKGQGTNPDLGFTFEDFQDEIDADRPVLIQVTGHTMLGYGYNTEGSIIYIHDTWDYQNHSMVWGGAYSGLQHYGVTVFRLEETTPIADFSGTPITGIKPLEVQFTDLSKGNIDSWSWNFGDGGTSEERNPSHTYATSDDFTVDLTVSGDGGSDIVEKTAYIHVIESAEISGTVTLSGGNGLVEEVTLILSGDDSQTTHPDEILGNYSFTVASGGNYTVTPSLSDYNFLPGSIPYESLSPSETGQNYTGYQNTNLTNISNFFAVPGIEQLTLAWTNPSADSFAGVLIVGQQTATEPTWTTPVNGDDYGVGNSLGTATVSYNETGNTYNHTGLPNNTNYYYKAYSYSAGPIYLPGVVTSGRSAEFVSASDGPINATTGGTVSGEGISVTIPAVALSGDATVTISRVENPPSSLFIYGLQCGFDIDLGGATLNPGSKITITLPYTDDDLNQAGVTDAHNLKVYYYNDSSSYPADWHWEEVPVISVDTVNQEITFEVEHCSIFSFGSQASIISLPQSSTGGGGGCFIATAAFGTPMAEEVIILKKFRNNVLLKYPLGRDFVKLYYATSPSIADFIRNKPFIKAMVRIGLEPLIWLSKQVNKGVGNE